MISECDWNQTLSSSASGGLGRVVQFVIEFHKFNILLDNLQNFKTNKEHAFSNYLFDRHFHTHAIITYWSKF